MPEDLSVLDQLDAPDDWRTIEQRAPGRLPVGPNNTRRRITAAATAIVVAVAAGTFLAVRFDRSAPLSETPTPPPAACVPGWVISPKPYSEGVSSDLLVAASATSPSDVWAVGTRFLTGARADDSVPLIERWDGYRWQVVPGADTGGRGGFLTDVVAIAPDNAWAVGGLHGIHGDDLIEHWDGANWSIFEGDPENLWGLEEIAAIAPDDVWAHGVSFPVVGGESISRDIYEHWDGTSWATYEGPLVVEPSVGYSATQVISVTPSGDAWAGGGTIRGFGEAGQISGALIERWNGEAWVVVSPPSGHAPVSELAVLNGGDVWATTGGGLSTVGSYGYGGASALIHWDGESWGAANSPDGSINQLFVRGSDGVWGLGSSKDGGPLVGPIRDGGWHPIDMTAPLPATGGLTDASVTSDGTLIAFGSDYPKALGGGFEGGLGEENSYLWIDCG
jgi:hypothetical protein